MTEGHKRKSHEHRSDLAGEHRWGDIGQSILLVVFIIGMVADVFVFHFSSFVQDPVPWYIPVIVFLPIFLLAGYFAQKAHKKIFQEERKELVVIKSDVYSQLRHPMYFGSILLFLSFVVLSLSLVALGIFIVIVCFYYFLCWYEEKVLVEKLGKEYEEYMKQVPMLFPKLRS